MLGCEFLSVMMVLGGDAVKASLHLIKSTPLKQHFTTSSMKLLNEDIQLFNHYDVEKICSFLQLASFHSKAAAEDHPLKSLVLLNPKK